ncbi:MAG: M23 family metallopeptidase [Pseudomonadota bacterium]
MLTRLRHRFHTALERRIPEKRLFLRTDVETRFVRLGPGTQLIAWTGSTAIVAWAIVATAILLMDSIGAGNFREQAKREQAIYEDRLNSLTGQRDARAAEAVAAQERFNLALEQVSIMQAELLESEDRRRELERGMEVVQATLRRVAVERDAAQEALAEELATLAANGGAAPDALRAGEVEATLAFLADALAVTAEERDTEAADAALALSLASEMETELKLLEARNDQIFRRLEEAMTVSVEPLDKMFRAAGLPTESLLEQVRRGYSGQGGPLTPLMISTRGSGPNPDGVRANRILDELDRMNLYRIAAERAPFSHPVRDRHRFTSGFGPRWGRMHNGADFAAPTGTDIFATADGVVIHAGWLSGYGRLIKIQHEFGIETRYAHLSKIRVNVGQRVSRGQHIGDMGNSGRSTGTHLHYEIRVGGKPVNPMIYIKAAQDVF